VVRKKCSRNQLLRFTSNLRVSLIGMEACGGPTSWVGLYENRGMMYG
jgi:hypothetical protein